MEDIKKIQEFFSKPMKEDFGQALFNRLKPKDEDLEAIVDILIQDPKIANSPDQASFKEALERYIRFSSDRNTIGQAAVQTLNYRNTGDRYGSGFNRIFDMLKNKNKISEAKSEDPVDTITMDVPLFIRMLEYSREDAQEDMDLHDVAEKAISLNKEKDILSMEDYNEIVGGTEEIDEASDYMKRRKSQDDYAVNKKDKPKKSYNPTPSGKTDYMKRREKELAEAVLNKLKK